MPGSKSNSTFSPFVLRRIPQAYSAMVNLAGYTGLRVSELAALRWRDIPEFSSKIVKRTVRGQSKARRSPLC
jgi:integrase